MTDFVSARGFSWKMEQWRFREGVSFTVQTQGGTGCELVLFEREAREPYAVIPFPEEYRIGHVYSMIVFDLDISEFEYAYRINGPYDPKRVSCLIKTGCFWILMQKQ